MRRDSRHAHQAVQVAQARGRQEQPQPVDERRHGGGRAAQLQAHQAAEAPAEARGGQRVGRVLRQPWVVDAGYGRVIGKEGRHYRRAGALPLHAQRQGLHAAQDLLGLEGPQRCAEQPALAHQAGVKHPGARRDHAARRVAVAGEILGGAVDHKVGAEGQGALQHWRGDRAVYHEPGPARLAERGEPADVGHAQQRVRELLHQQQVGLQLRHGRLSRLEIAEVGVGHAHAARREQLLQQHRRRAVQVARS